MDYKEQKSILLDRETTMSRVIQLMELSTFDDDTLRKVTKTLNNALPRVENVMDKTKVESLALKEDETAEDVTNYKFCRRRIDLSRDYTSIKLIDLESGHPTHYLIERKDGIKSPTLTSLFIKHGIEYFKELGYITYKLTASDWSFVKAHSKKPRLAIRTSSRGAGRYLDDLAIVTLKPTKARKAAEKRGFNYWELLGNSKVAEERKERLLKEQRDEQRAWDREVDDFFDEKTGPITPYTSGRSSTLKK